MSYRIASIEANGVEVHEELDGSFSVRSNTGRVLAHFEADDPEHDYCSNRWEAMSFARTRLD
jgi:hypothetical protein